MSSRKTLFTFPITTYEAAFLATIPLPPGLFPRSSNSGSSSGGRKSRKGRRSRWHQEEEETIEEKYSYTYSTQYYEQEQVTNGHQDIIYSAGLTEGEYLDMFRPPTPLKIEDDVVGPAKLYVPEVIVTAGDRKGSFENMEFNMYYEIHPESIKINCKNLNVPNALANPNHYSQISIANSAVAGETNAYYPCLRLAEQADVLEKWLDGFYSEKEPSSVNSDGKCGDENAGSELVNNHSSSSSDPLMSSADRNNVQNYYQNPDSNSCELNDEQLNGTWISNSKVKLGKFKFLRNEHCSELVATSNRLGASGDLIRTSKSAVSDDSDSGGWVTETAEETRNNEGGGENEENQEARGETFSNLSKSGKKRGKGANSGSVKSEPAGERRRSSRIRSMEEKREKEREKLKETKGDGAINSTSETSSPAEASPTPPPISSSADLRDEATASSLDAKTTNETDSRTSGEFAVPPSPWNGVHARSNHQHRESESGSSPSANSVGAPVKVKSRWRRCSELEGVVRDSGNGLSNSKMYNSAPCSPTSLGTARMVSELFHLARPPPPPPSMNTVGFFGPGEITEDWSEQEVSTSLTKNPLPLKLRPVPAPVIVEVKGPLPPPPPPPKEKPPYLNYDEITENVHLSTRLRSKARKEVRRMVCDCTLTKEEIVRGYQGCGDDCLNRLLMMECGSRCPTGERCSNRKFQKKEYAAIEPFKTDMKGYGLKCKEDLDEGEFVIEYVGEVLDQREFKKRVKEYAADKQRHHYFMALKADQIIDATQRGNFSRFINHSCDPNCETQKWTVSGELRIGFFTRRAIKAGEEITFDYQFQRYGKEAQRCYCEASNCRGLIGGDKQTPLKKEKEKDKKDKRRKTYEERRREFGEDVDLQEEIEKFSQLKGLTNRNQTLNLCRLMVRAEDVESRTTLLCCLQRTNEAACLRLFLDYHGLSLIWSWMMDTGNNETSIPFKAEVLKTLSKLPIASRSMVMENKLMPAIQKWAAQIVEAENARTQEKSEEKKVEKMETDDNKENDVCKDSVNLSTNQICADEESSRSVNVDDEISCQEPLNQSDSNKSPKKADHVEGIKICVKEDETAIKAVNEVITNGGIEMECELENSNSDLPSDVASESESNLADAKSELSNECVDKMEINSDKVEPCSKAEKVNSNENEPSSVDIEKISSNIELPSNTSESISVSTDDGEKIKLEVLQSSVANLAASLLDSWSELKQLYRIPKREQAQNRKDHEREADGDSDEEDDYDDEDDKEHNDRDRYYRDRDRDEDDRHRRDRGKRDHREDRDKWKYNSKKRRLNSRPRISKEERRQLFEQKVQQEEQEALRWQQAEYFRQQQEAQLEAQAQMEMYYSAGYTGLPGQAIAYYDPNSGYTIPAMAPVPPMTTDAVLVAAPGVVDATPPTATPDINMTGVPPIATLVPTVIPQVVPLDPSITSPIAGVPAVVQAPEAVVVPNASVYDNSVTPGPVTAPVVYPIYSTATNPASTGFIANSSTAPFVTPQGQPIYYPPPQGVVVIPQDQSAWSHIIPAVETPPSAPPEPPKPVKLPPSWKTAKDDEGNTYYYHAVTRQTQWDPPTCEEEEASEELTPVENHKSKKSNSESSGEYSRRIKESFRSKMSQFIVQYLNPYRKPDCKQGRIASTEEFKHLARKLTHFVMAKELKYCRNVEDLECNENVKHKAKDFVKKYMGKFGANYKKTASPKDEDEI